jgi:acetyl esterase/lipase
MEYHAIFNRVYKTVTTRDNTKIEITADIYYREGNKNAPLYVYFHGGAWVGGKKDIPLPRDPWLTPNFIDDGYVIVSVEYRLVGNHGSILDDCVNDCSDAIRYFVKNAGIYGIDANRIIVGGTSAGAHIALLCALAGDRFGSDSELARIAYRCLCVLDFCGPTEFNSLMEHFEPARKQGAILQFLDGLDISKRHFDEISPCYYAQNAEMLPPVFAVHGLADTIVPHTQPEQLKEIYSRKGGEFLYLPVENGDHLFSQIEGLPAPSPAYSEIQAAVRRFISMHIQ